MDSVQAAFEERSVEVRRHMRFMEKFDRTGTNLTYMAPSRVSRIAVGDEQKQILKAGIFLLLYNQIESSIVSGFRAVYSQIDSHNLSFPELRLELQSIWIESKIAPIMDPSSSLRTYTRLTTRIVEDVANGARPKFSDLHIGHSGNLNSDRIRQLCFNHGISGKTHKRALGGGELETVRGRRNQLAHGDITFSECGREYTVGDLVRISHQVDMFIRGILRNIRIYVDNQAFRRDRTKT